MPERDASQERLAAIARALSIGRLERHIFLCADQSNPRCAPREETRAVWKHLKRRLKALGLASAPPPWQGRDVAGVRPEETPAGCGRVLRTKADCLRICEQGPIAVVYPDGVWYRGVTIEVMDRIIDEHLVGGRPVESHVFARDPLRGAPQGGG